MSLLFLVLLPGLACRSKEKAATTEAPSSVGEAASEKAEPDETAAKPITLSEEEIRSSGIKTTEVLEGAIEESLPIQGRVLVRSGQQASVIPTFPGRLLVEGSHFPAVGSAVRQGQLLAVVVQELSATEAISITEKRIDIESQIQQAAQEVAQKKRDLERTKVLYEGGVVALKQVQLAETDLHIAEAHQQAAMRARAAYEKVQGDSSSSTRRIKVLAPISGIITAVNAAPNQQVDNTKSIFEIANLNTVWIEAQVFEDQLPIVRRAPTVAITTRAAPGVTFNGRLVNFSQQVDPVSKTEGVIYEVANKNSLLAIGMNADVHFPSGNLTNGLVIPASAIIEEEGHSLVFVETEPGTFEKREVKTGARSTNGVIIRDGLKAGEKVVSTGAQNLLNAGEGEEEGKE
jgi:RND family efflux transporter MFP subunit